MKILKIIGTLAIIAIFVFLVRTKLLDIRKGSLKFTTELDEKNRQKERHDSLFLAFRVYSIEIEHNYALIRQCNSAASQYLMMASMATNEENFNLWQQAAETTMHTADSLRESIKEITKLRNIVDSLDK